MHPHSSFVITGDFNQLSEGLINSGGQLTQLVKAPTPGTYCCTGQSPYKHDRDLHWHRHGCVLQWDTLSCDLTWNSHVHSGKVQPAAFPLATPKLPLATRKEVLCTSHWPGVLAQGCYQVCVGVCRPQSGIGSSPDHLIDRTSRTGVP